MRQKKLLFLSHFAITVALSLSAHAGVGVTSQTDGEPLGKPPTDAERILRVGVDIQVDELITTRQDDRAHIVFVDGTSLTVGPNAKLKIDRFVYDPNAKTGELAISMASGVLRVVGGRISKTAAIKVNTPSAVIGIRGGIAILDVGSQQTKAQFLFGTSMDVSSNGLSQTASRAGSEVVTRFGGPPGAPGMIALGGVASAFNSLEGRNGGRGGRGDTAPDERARQSGFSDRNSGQGILAPSQAITPAAIGSSASQALSNSNIQNAKTIPVTAQITSPPPVSMPSIPQPEPWCRDGSFREMRERRERHR